MKISTQSHFQTQSRWNYSIDEKHRIEAHEHRDKQTDRQRHEQPESRGIQPANLRARYLVSFRRQPAMQPATRPASKSVSHATEPASQIGSQSASQAAGQQPASQPAPAQVATCVSHFLSASEKGVRSTLVHFSAVESFRRYVAPI